MPHTWSWIYRDQALPPYRPLCAIPVTEQARLQRHQPIAGLVCALCERVGVVFLRSRECLQQARRSPNERPCFTARASDIDGDGEM